MSRKYNIVVDRSGRGRTLTVTRNGQPIGTAGVQPGNVSRATIRKREQPEDFVLPQQTQAEDDETTSEEATASEVSAERLRSTGPKPAGINRSDRMNASIAEKLSKMRK